MRARVIVVQPNALMSLDRPPPYWKNSAGYCLNMPPTLAYSPDLAPNDFHLGRQRFNTDEEVKEAVSKFIDELAAEREKRVFRNG